jgi:hypothetical protein
MLLQETFWLHATKMVNKKSVYMLAKKFTNTTDAQQCEPHPKLFKCGSYQFTSSLPTLSCIQPTKHTTTK